MICKATMAFMDLFRTREGRISVQLSPSLIDKVHNSIIGFRFYQLQRQWLRQFWKQPYAFAQDHRNDG